MAMLTARNTEAHWFVITHEDSQKTVMTDPPIGHGGEGASFPPVDLAVAALLSCTGTVIMIKAASLHLDTYGMSMSADYTMAEAPTRIAACDMRIAIPGHPDARQKRSLMLATKACPVRNSLHPDIAISITFAWADGTTDIMAE
ncbi:MAG: OsmC family protein [Rhodospirillaceae bacterium]